METKIKYQILEASNSEILEQIVDEAFALGWVLQGGVSVVLEDEENGLWTLFQAMTHE